MSEAEIEVEKHDGFIAVDDHQKDVNKQHKKFRDEERSHAKTKERADSAQKELDTLKAKDINVDIPPLPDQYADDFQDQIKVRDDAIQRKATHDAQTSTVESEKQKNEEARIKRAEESDREKVAAFDSNMITLGLNPQDVKKAADTVIEYGMSDTLQDVVLEDADGPLLVQYLANNPIEIESLNTMSVLQLVNHINGDIRQKASLLKPKTSNAPDPPVTLSGGGVSEMEDPLLKGAVFE